MTSQLPEHPPMNTQLEAYIDGVLNTADRAAFEARLKSDPALRAEVELQTSIDASLSRLFKPCEVAAPAAAPAPFRVRRWIPFAAAAAIALAAALWWMQPAAPPAQTPLARRQPTAPNLRGQYQFQVRTGFTPMAVCTTPDAFQEWVQQNYGQPLRPTATPDNIQLVGWSYSDLISDYTGILLARVDGQPVIVAMDKSELQTKPIPEGEGPEHIFQKTVNGLTLYEVTPLAEPRILPLLQ